MLLRLVLLTMLGSSSASAQTPFSSAIRGEVRDTTAAVLPRATVTITAPTLIRGAQSTTTDDSGKYRFSRLPPGVYDIAVRADAFRPTRRVAISVASGATVTIDFALDVAGLEDEVVIRGGSPLVDVRSAAVPVRLDEDLIANLPTSRSIATLINLAPGVAADVAFGGSQRGNEILLDGVRTTDPLFQDPLLRANYNWVQEVNVVALGAAAEYGGFTGTAAHAVLRSGSSRTPGSASCGQPDRDGWRTTRRSCQRLCSDSSSRANCSTGTTPVAKLVVRSSKTDCSSSAVFRRGVTTIGRRGSKDPDPVTSAICS